MFARPQQHIHLLLVEDTKQLLAFRCESSVVEQLAALARQGDRSVSAELRRAAREHCERSSSASSSASAGRHAGRGSALGENP